MGYWDYYYKGPYKNYHRDPFPHSLLRTRQTFPFTAMSVVVRFLPAAGGILGFSCQGTSLPFPEAKRPILYYTSLIW